ncbi:MAG: cyclodeaminase/cyclohydrolase family protein [Planctomycetota bacterium]
MPPREPSSDDAAGALRRLIDAIAGPEPLPAGGAAAVAAIAMGLGLGAKVIRRSSPDPAASRPISALLEQVLPQFEADGVAFARVLEAQRQSKDAAVRSQAWRQATEVSVAVARLAEEAERLLLEGASVVRASMAADHAAAVDLVRAGREIALRNARDNARH